MKKSLLPLALIASALPAFAADPAADAETQLREQLRATLLQLRSAQTEAANQQALQAAAEAKTADLEKKVETLEKRLVQDSKAANDARDVFEGKIADLNNQLAAKEKTIVQYMEALDKWKEGYQKAAEIARTKEGERAQLAEENAVLKNTVADRERKNINLFNAASEILDRYEGYALGKAISAKEPFIGRTRVKIENQVQGYQDKIIDNRISANPSEGN